jgi:hypothetical protein
MPPPVFEAPGRPCVQQSSLPPSPPHPAGSPAAEALPPRRCRGSGHVSRSPCRPTGTRQTSRRPGRSHLQAGVPASCALRPRRPRQPVHARSGWRPTSCSRSGGLDGDGPLAQACASPRGCRPVCTADDGCWRMESDPQRHRPRSGRALARRRCRLRLARRRWISPDVCCLVLLAAIRIFCRHTRLGTPQLGLLRLRRTHATKSPPEACARCRSYPRCQMKALRAPASAAAGQQQLASTRICPPSRLQLLLVHSPQPSQPKGTH